MTFSLVLTDTTRIIILNYTDSLLGYPNRYTVIFVVFTLLSLIFFLTSFEGLIGSVKGKVFYVECTLIFPSSSSFTFTLSSLQTSLLAVLEMF